MKIYLNIHFPIHEYSLWIFMNIYVNSRQIDLKNLKNKTFTLLEQQQLVSK